MPAFRLFLRRRSIISNRRRALQVGAWSKPFMLTQRSPNQSRYERDAQLKADIRRVVDVLGVLCNTKRI